VEAAGFGCYASWSGLGGRVCFTIQMFEGKSVVGTSDVDVATSDSVVIAIWPALSSATGGGEDVALG
jgi:hypothetical protein